METPVRSTPNSAAFASISAFAPTSVILARPSFTIFSAACTVRGLSALSQHDVLHIGGSFRSDFVNDRHL